MITNKLRILLGAAALAAAAAACERSPLQMEAPRLPDALPASWDLEPAADTFNIDTGYFGSGHHQLPPSDSLGGDDPG